jgi:hypothetical protein
MIVQAVTHAANFNTLEENGEQDVTCDDLVKVFKKAGAVKTGVAGTPEFDESDAPFTVEQATHIAKVRKRPSWPRSRANLRLF